MGLRTITCQCFICITFISFHLSCTSLHGQAVHSLHGFLSVLLLLLLTSLFGFERPACVVFCLVSGFMFDVLSSRRPLSSWARAAVVLVVSILSHLRMAQGSFRGVHYQRLLVQALARIRSHTCPHTRTQLHAFVWLR